MYASAAFPPWAKAHNADSDASFEVDFNSDFNEITLFSSDGKRVNLEFSKKEDLATQMLELIIK